jgi:hypothetical protein
MSLNPRVDPANADSAKPGWSIGDAEDNSKLFIDENTGNVGIGSVTPFGKLDVNGIVRASSLFNASKDPDSGMSNGGSLVIKSNAPQIDFIDTDHNDWSIHVNSNKMYFIRQPWNYKDLVLDGAGNIGIGTDSPVAKLEVNGTAVISNGNSYATRKNFMASGSLTVGSINANYGGGKSWNPSTAGLLLEAKDNTEIAVHDSGTRVTSLMYYEGSSANRITIGRDMGWGPIKQVMFAGAITPAAGNSENAGIMFKKNAFGGGGDAAWLRYYARSGEATTLELGTSNDRNDHIALMSSGNVGVGTISPSAKLEVYRKGGVSYENNAFKVRTDHGYMTFGSLNSGWFHMHTDRPQFYFNKPAQAKGGFRTYSTRDVKKDIRYLSLTDEDQILKSFSELRMATFRYKDTDLDDKSHIGVIAEEAPEAVVTESGKSIDLYDYISYGMAALKALQRQLGVMEERLQKIE